MTEPAISLAPEPPLRFDAQKALAVLNQSYLGAVLLFVDQRGRKPFPGEAAALRRGVAQKALDNITAGFGPAAPTIVDREAVELLAAEALGGPFSEPE